jgi:hypothetical protein
MMTIGALALPQLGLRVPPLLKRTTMRWARLTNTGQFWGMFAPAAPKWRTWLIVDVVTATGQRRAAYDDRSLIGNRAYPYVFVDRRQKIHSKIASPRHEYRQLHARWVCRSWLGPSGERPAAVALSTWSWPIPRPEWTRVHGPRDPRPEGEMHRRDQPLVRLECDP